MCLIKKKKIVCLLLFPIIYIYIYNPVFRCVNISFLRPLLVVSFLGLFAEHKINSFLVCVKKQFIFFYIFFLIAFIMSGVFGKDGVMLAYKHMQAFFETFVIGYFLSEIIKYYKIDILKYIIFIGVIASLITIYLLLNPMKSVHIRTNVITDSLVDLGYDAKQHMWRSFGVAEGLTSIYGVIQGFLAALCVINIEKSILYLLPIPFLVLAAFVNARTGLLIFLVPVPFFLMYTLRWKKGFVIYIAVLTLAICLYMFFLNDEIKETVEWGFSMFKDIGNLMSGEKTGNIKVLLEDMLFFPKNEMSFLFGTGSMAISEKGKTSDISFINQIFIGGFFYMFIIFLFLVYLTIFSYRRTKSFSFATLVFCSLMFMNIKGMDPTLPNGLVRLLFLYLFSVSKKPKELIICKQAVLHS